MSDIDGNNFEKIHFWPDDDKSPILCAFQVHSSVLGQQTSSKTRIKSLKASLPCKVGSGDNYRTQTSLFLHGHGCKLKSPRKLDCIKREELDGVVSILGRSPAFFG